MGTTPVIENLKNKNKEFADLLATQQANMTSTMQPFVDTFEPFVAGFYKTNNWDIQPMGQEVRSDLQQQSTFTLDNIAAVIQTIANELLSGNIGQLVGADSAKAGDAATALAGDVAKMDGAGLMVTAAVACIGSVMGLFSTRSASLVGKGMESHRVAPGLTLHAYSFSAQAEASTIVATDSIVMSSIGYRLIYSFKQASVEQGMSFMTHLTTQMQALEATLATLQADVDTMLTDTSIAMEKVEAVQTRLDWSSAHLTKYQDDSGAAIKRYAGG